jgi:hypothetical protein
MTEYNSEDQESSNQKKTNSSIENDDEYIKILIKTELDLALKEIKMHMS